MEQPILPLPTHTVADPYTFQIFLLEEKKNSNIQALLAGTQTSLQRHYLAAPLRQDGRGSHEGKRLRGKLMVFMNKSMFYILESGN